MDLVAGCGSGDCWVELRPLITSEVKTGKFTPVLFTHVLDALHNLGKPFRSFIVAPRDGGGGDDGGGVSGRLLGFSLSFLMSRQGCKCQISYGPYHYNEHCLKLYPV